MKLERELNRPLWFLLPGGLLLAAQPFLGRLERAFANARPRPVTPRYVRVSQVLQGDFSAAVSGLSTPRAALEHAQQRIEEILDAG